MCGSPGKIRRESRLSPVPGPLLLLSLSADLEFFGWSALLRKTPVGEEEKSEPADNRHTQFCAILSSTHAPPLKDHVLSRDKIRR